MTMPYQDDSIGTDDRDFVTALASGLDVILAFDQDHPRMTLSEVAARTGMNRARARRFLLTLHALGYVHKQQRHFELAPKTLQLGYSFLSANGYQSVIQQHLEHITQVTGESSSMGVLDGLDVTYVARSAARHRLMAITLSVGTRLPAMATSLGRMLLAQLSDDALDTLLARAELTAYTERTLTDPARLREQILAARQQGYCLVDQELDSGLRSLAIPAFNTHGQLIGAINLSTNAARVDRDTLMNSFLPLMQERAAMIARQVS
ncbi:IclR family transcriptional regulator domain-containing protein [Larsenimonas rhizosphaerae]|uniref:Helix-turn-helix domain-containing protein n=1 Tax=Larsenimonas rhizosphaerae TaxID=2944682 RepID=A0AA41ZH38_9GAMM|nr:IclR family transcriptional regulator C-terminal domain-containing protein [Larsenimonas rhizosphaerae]MCM2131521.1 helix-turn-helix domain-containing protein [Larsenimonas rhizosphaerae]MCX2525152.1 helix-turn-helix domain-containing protein [Larsenimonas rhizosphaerae]